MQTRSSSSKSSESRGPLGLVLSRQPFVWAMLAILYYAFDSGRQELPDYAELALRALGWGATGCVVSTLALLAYARAGLLTRRRALGWFACGALVASIAHLAVFDLLDGLVGIEDGWTGWWSWPQEQLVNEWMNYALCMVAWHGAASTLARDEQMRRERERALESERAAERARVAMLRYQLDPHFLFNSLNSAIALVDEDPGATQEMLARLAHLLRERLERPMDGPVPLSEELEMLEHYVAIEKVRFEEKPAFEQEIDDAALACALPPFILQPLVENAIHHGMRTSRPPLRVRLRATIERDELVVTLWNTGSFEEGEGVGLSNVRERLGVELGQEHEFSIGSSDGGVEAIVRVRAQEVDDAA